MSTLRTNTITDAAGANSMPVADINQGRAKVWATVTNAGSTALVDGFGVSSVIDAAIGSTQIVFSTPMSNVNYTYSTVSGGSPQVGGTVTSRVVGSCYTLFRNNAGFADIDSDFGLIIMGDS